MQTKFINEFNSIQLNRYPTTKNKSLQAWDAADSYLLEYLIQNKKMTEKSHLLIFNDSFGALTISLNNYNPTTITDSFLSKKAIESNAQLNHYSSDLVNVNYTLNNEEKKYDIVLIKVPKVLEYLNDFIMTIREYLHQNSIILIAGMVKNMPKSLWELLDKHFETSTTSLTKKKAKIIELSSLKEPMPSKFPIHFNQENSQLKIYSYPNVFSKNSMDIGTRFLLQNLPDLTNIKSVIDLGCGNGIIGLNIAVQFPTTEVTFIDESYMAIKSARLTCKKNLTTSNQHNFLVNDCLTGFAKDSYDLIVCNPPFHQSHSVSIDIALKMFQQSFFCLKKGGQFIVIANRHLPYYSHLKRIFNNCTTLSSNNKFNLFSSVK